MTLALWRKVVRCSAAVLFPVSVEQTGSVKHHSCGTYGLAGRQCWVRHHDRNLQFSINRAATARHQCKLTAPFAVCSFTVERPIVLEKKSYAMSGNSAETGLSERPGGEALYNDVKNYYGKVLKSQDDLKVPACLVPPLAMPRHIKDATDAVHDDVTRRYYGCGLVIPAALEGTSVLDLGSGTGRDCFAISKLVGEDGHVTGVDMTEEQVEVANNYIKYHTEKFGYKKPNINFVQGCIEKLGEVGIEDETVDIVISNCVINLSPDKRSVFKEAHRILKPGGEMYFSDIYADRDLPDHVRKHKVLWGECISGALWWKHLYEVAEETGFATPRLVSARSVAVDRPDLRSVVGDAKFYSATYRLFKLPLDAERHPAVATYLGGIVGIKEKLSFDHEYTFEECKPLTIDAELAAILKNSRFNKYFSLMDDVSGQAKQVPIFNLAVFVSSSDTSSCCVSDKSQEKGKQSCKKTTKFCCSTSAIPSCSERPTPMKTDI